jgi:hypothetical protein
MLGVTTKSIFCSPIAPHRRGTTRISSDRPSLAAIPGT